MLRRLVRHLGTLGALWTLAVLGAPSLLPACGMHGGDATHTMHAEHDGVRADAHTDAPHEVPADDCQCLDCCCAAGPLAFGIRATMRFREIITPSHAGWWATSEPAPPRALALRLPFANGPPGSTS